MQGHACKTSENYFSTPDTLKMGVDNGRNIARTHKPAKYPDRVKATVFPVVDRGRSNGLEGSFHDRRCHVRELCHWSSCKLPGTARNPEAIEKGRRRKNNPIGMIITRVIAG